MKRGSERDSSPAGSGATRGASSAKRPRERERESSSSASGSSSSRRGPHRSSAAAAATTASSAAASTSTSASSSRSSRDKSAPSGSSSRSHRGEERPGGSSGDSNHRAASSSARSSSSSSQAASAAQQQQPAPPPSSSSSSRLLGVVKAKVPPAAAAVVAPSLLLGVPPPVAAPSLLLAPGLGLASAVGLAGDPPGSSEYKTLLVSGLSPALPDQLLEDGLFRQFQRFASGGASDISVKLSHTPELGRVAYVNFRHPADARDARRHARARQLLLYDRPLKVEPVYLRGGRRSRTPPPTPSPEPLAFLPPIHGVYPYKQRSLSPVASPLLREPRQRHAQAAAAAFALEAALGLSRERERVLDYFGLYDERGRPYGYPIVAEEDLMPEDDLRATRNLFIGNLDHNVSEVELRRAFEKYGIIEEVVIKRPARGQGGAYAFLKFQNLDMAHRAKVAMSGRVIGRNPIKIGYGKANPTTRLWVGGLGPSTSLAALAREFDRFGSIRTIDHVKGDSFAYIQYESLDAAQAACAQMRGFPLGGPDRRLRVDFAKAEETRYPQQYQPAPLPVHYELLPESYSRHRSLEQDLRVRDRTPPHLLYSDRERSFLEADWTSPAKNAERRNNLETYSRSARSRSGDRWGSDSDRSVLKPWEERRKRRSLSNDRGRAAQSPYEDRGRTKAGGGGGGGGPALDRSPDRARKENHTTESAAEKEQNNSLQNNRHASEEKPHRETSDPPQAKKRDSERNHRTGESESKAHEDSKSETKKLKSLSDYAHTLQLAWNGLLVLKNSCFPTSMHILEGDLGVINGLLKDHLSGGKLTQLKIAQRLRLDQPKLDEVTRRIKQGSPNGYAVLLATQAAQGGAGIEGTFPGVEPGLQRRLLRNLVSYLKQKQAAGVISLPVGGAKGRDSTGMLYAFPPCEFSQQYLQSALRTLGKLEEEHMVIVIVKDTA